jgi:hypothetical protein
MTALKPGIIVFLMTISIESALMAASVTWTGSMTGAWSTPSNWSSGAVPGNADDAGLYSNVTVSVNGITATVNSITMNPPGLAGNLQIESPAGSVLNVIGDFIQNNGAFTVRQIAAPTPGAVIGGNYSATKGQITLLQRDKALNAATVNGNLTATGNFTFIFKLNGAKEYSVISVGGTTTLGSANLSLDPNSTSTNDTLLLIQNTSTNALVGTFGNATFGVTTYTLNGADYTLRAVDYDGGGVANDIVLTTAAPVSKKTLSLVFISSR